MRKHALMILAALATNLSLSDTITNYVYVVSNQYFRQVREITNRVSTVTYKTNVTVRVDVSDAAIARAEYEADRSERAAANSMGLAESAAGAATRAESAASSAAAALATVDNRADWLQQNFGKMVTNVSVIVTTNITLVVPVEEKMAKLASALGYVSNAVFAASTVTSNALQYGSTKYPRIMVYSAAQELGKVSVKPTANNAFATSAYSVDPSVGYPSGASWTFVPAYVDTDQNGIRLQYVVETASPIRWSSSSDRYIVPEYFYWQNGYIYLKLNTVVNGVADGGYFIGKGLASSYPNDGWNTGSYRSASVISKNNWGSSDYPDAKIENKSRLATAGAPLWFPDTLSPTVSAIVSWMVLGH